jgi:hypothetical protein
MKWKGALNLPAAVYRNESAHVATLARYCGDVSCRMEEKKTCVSAATKFCAMKATVSWPRVPQARVWWAEERRKRAEVGRVSFMFVGFVRS